MQLAHFSTAHICNFRWK